MSDIYEIRTSIDISAKAEDVWRVLQDFMHYPEWNPFIISIEGGRSIGSK
ncbi:MAG: SRPBCC family protein [Euryarchaeota archaeon]|nr:SRPBCC family protein [Euryarchaeota archaeon]